jgi:hypothetical protein
MGKVITKAQFTNFKEDKPDNHSKFLKEMDRMWDTFKDGGWP